MRVYLALVALSAGASATSAVEASTPAGVAETHAERELLTRSEAKTRQLERKLPKLKTKREKVDAKVPAIHGVRGTGSGMDGKGREHRRVEHARRCGAFFVHTYLLAPFVCIDRN